MQLGRNAVHHVFNGAVQQLHQQCHYQHQGQQYAVAPGLAQPAGQRQAREAAPDYLAESLLVPPGRRKAVAGIAAGIPESPQTGTPFELVAEIVRRLWTMRSQVAPLQLSSAPDKTPGTSGPVCLKKPGRASAA